MDEDTKDTKPRRNRDTRAAVLAAQETYAKRREQKAIEFLVSRGWIITRPTPKTD